MAGDKESVTFDCKILKDKEGNLLFKMEFGKGRSVEGSSLRQLQSNMQEQYCPEKTLFGAYLEWIYGFQSARIRKAIHDLPNAVYCERFKGWVDSPPEPPVITNEIIQGRRAAHARLQKQPEGDISKSELLLL
eukprot:TRINITY_DN13569_c0_g1_i2.p2 TRINITY_DN13569_c0_g1~~TRINITY_DN13569_c0_g1_i2.p2  ORF type:complete len:133 (+),score=16.21 TRINITY_DN13569_c0_g1_i2:308-706(+)